MDFTNEQLAIISHHEGNCVVIAGAGSGKTRCLVERSASLIEKGFDPRNILLFTFTKKAANEISTRICKRLDIDPQKEDSIHTSTIHSLALTIFREHIEDIGYSSDKVTLWEPARRAVSLRRLVKDVMTNKTNPFNLPIPDEEFESILDGFSEDNDESFSDSAFIKFVIAECQDAFLEFPPTPTLISGIGPQDYYDAITKKQYSSVVATVCTIFLVSKNCCSVIEFDDMIPGACKVLRDIDTEWKTKFEHVMCDEYQDVNDTNVEFIRLLSNHPENVSLMVVGDDDQAIYGFRGANTRHILEFPKVFNGDVLYLTKNFRSCKSIVDLANKIISNNKVRYDKTMVPHKEFDGSVMLIEPFWTQDKLQLINETRKEVYLDVFRLINGYIHFVGLEPKDIAILARNNYNLTMANSAFKTRNRIIREEIKIFETTGQKPENGILDIPIPFSASSIANMFQSKFAKQIIDVLRLFINPKDYVTARDVFLNCLSGFGNKTAEYFVKAAQNNPEQSIVEYLRAVTDFPRHGAKTKKGKAILSFADYFEKTVNDLDEENILECWVKASLVAGVESELDNMMQKNNKSRRLSESHRENLDELYKWIAQSEIKDISTLLDEISTEISEFNSSDSNEVELMTIHGSKGKEWSVVFLLDIDGETLPSPRSHDLEEERRVFYVGITRAADSLIVCRSNESSSEQDDVPLSIFWSEMEIPSLFDQ